ncbi:MAG: fatty acid--CoA ligase [Acidobacteriota bacterium]
MSETAIRVVADIPRAHAAKMPDKVAMVFRDRETTFAKLDERASRVANGLIAEGLRPETRIALLDKNSDSFFEVLFGAAKSNTVLAVVNWRLAPAEMAYVINDAMAEVLFVGEEFFPHVEQVIGSLKTVKKIIALDGSRSGWDSYEEWRERQSIADPRLEAVGSDVVFQLYTSGTTGNPKGAQLTSDNCLALLPVAIKLWGNWTSEDINLVCMPLYHIGGTGWGLVGLYVGALSVITRETSPAEILQVIERHRVTKTFFVPALILFLLQSPDIHSTDLSSLKLIVYGASPIPIDLLRSAMKVFKCGFAQVYGLTETTGAFTYLPPEEHDPNGNERMRSCGKPYTTIDVRVVDADGNPLPPGEVGEIVCRSPQVMKGYWNLADATASAIRDGWFYTGDAGYFDEEGYLYIHDRLKDMIISGGENIYPAEVESVIFSHPAVADVAVIGVPDEKWGEAVKAVVVKKAGADVTEEDIIAFARERMAHYKAPRSVDFVAALPRNPSGKILKRELRKPYWEGRNRQVN